VTYVKKNSIYHFNYHVDKKNNHLKKKQSPDNFAFAAEKRKSACLHVGSQTKQTYLTQ